MNYTKDTCKGRYKLIFPEKYIGNRPPNYKSKWEKKVFYALDVNPNVIKWGYECIEIYYHHPVYNKHTVYYPDIFCHIKNDNGKIQQILVEIKPAKMCVIPKPVTLPKNKTLKAMQTYKKSLQRHKSASIEFAINSAKWEAAQKWCIRHNVKWIVSNEKNTGLFYTSKI